MSVKFDIKEIQIRKYRKNIDELMKGLQDSEQSLWNKTAPWKEISRQYLAHMMAMQETSEGTCLTAWVEGEMVGFIFGYLEEPDETRIEINTGKELYISDGYVIPAYRRKGIYKTLNMEIERKYTEKGIRRISRFTLASNENMKSFLARSGFSVTRLLFEKWL